MSKTLGQIAYDAYCEKRNWKSFNGDQLPHWGQQSEDLRAAWEAAGTAVAKQIALETGRG